MEESRRDRRDAVLDYSSTKAGSKAGSPGLVPLIVACWARYVTGQFPGPVSPGYRRVVEAATTLRSIIQVGPGGIVPFDVSIFGH
jgi:hypothetical protein